MCVCVVCVCLCGKGYNIADIYLSAQVRVCVCVCLCVCCVRVCLRLLAVFCPLRGLAAVWSRAPPHGTRRVAPRAPNPVRAPSPLPRRAAARRS